MNYIYDILLNFNEHLIEYFQWDESDNIKYVKKVIIFKTDEKTIKDIVENEVLLDTKFTTNIPKYDINNIKNECKICLLTDGKIVIGILIENNKVKYISRLLLDEEYDALLSSDNLITTKIDYKIIKYKTKEDTTLTRFESKIKKQLLEELDSLYKNNKNDKLIYLYYEFTNSENKDVEYIYMYLKNSLKNFCDRHIHLFNILSISNVKAE